MIKIGNSYIETARICYVTVEPYPGTSTAYIPKVEIEIVEIKSFSGKVKSTKKIRKCADCGEELDEGDKYCQDCYDDGQQDDGDYIIYMNWEHGDLGFTAEELTKEEYMAAVRQLDGLTKK